MPNPPSAATAAAIMAQVGRLDRSQWWPVEVLRDRQRAQLQVLLQHAHRHSAFYRQRFDAAGALPDSGIDEETFGSIPLLRRSELLTEEAAINCGEVPASHGPVSVTQTSGSTGQIVKVRRTAVNQLMWWALVMRDHAWHRRDFSLPFAAIRANVPVLDDETKAAEVGWGAPVRWLRATGPGYARPIGTDVSELAGWLCRRDPGYLLTYPTYLGALLTYFERHGRTLPRLREVRTIGETLQPEVRARCRAILGVPVVDSYSSQEVGAIALQCPDSGSYHVHAESLIVEVLDDDGRACPPGQIGRVVVTDLHNFATPLIRYELRDHAEVGTVCACGRGLPTLARVLGRQRNMVTLPDGRRHWPLLGFTRYRDIAPVLQYQVVQHSLEDVEMRLVAVGGALDVGQERRLIEVLREALGHPFPVRITYFEHELPRSRSAKFEEFLSFVE